MYRAQLSLKQNGNALFYVLLGVVLLAALSYTITRQNVSGGAAQQLSDEQAEIYTAQVINHANVVKAAIDQMLATGSIIDDIDFVRPGEAGYDTPPHINKVYHPSGGGIEPMQIKKEFTFEGAIYPAWVIQNTRNVEWTPTNATDILFTFREINEKICKKINLKIIGTDTIQRLDSGSFNQLFDKDISTNVQLNTGTCSHCKGYASLCVRHSVGDTFAFYNVVAAR